MKTRKNLLIALVVAAGLAIVGVGVIFLARRRTAEPSVEAPVVEGKLLETAPEDRPYVSLTPRADGKELTLTITRVKNAETIDYELVYLAEGDLSRGVIGSIKYQEEASISRQLLLGSCSRNVCKYDEGVEKGSLTLKFRSPEGVRRFESDFTLTSGETTLTGQGGEFSLEGIPASAVYFITMSTVGLPAEVEGSLASGPFGVFSSGSVSAKNGRAVFRGFESGLRALVWKGQKWTDLDEAAAADSGEVAFKATGPGTFILVNPPDSAGTETP